METVKIKKRIPQGAKEIRDILAGIKANVKNPLVLRTEVSITQTLDGRGYLDWATVSVRKIWHDGATVTVETTEGDVIRLMNSYETCSDGHYADAWWDIKNLCCVIKSIQLRSIRPSHFTKRNN